MSKTTHPIDPQALEIIVKAPDGRELPAKVHWSEPRRLCKTTIKSAEGAILGEVIDGEMPESTPEGLKFEPTADVYQKIFREMEGPEYENCIAETEPLPRMRTLGSIALETPIEIDEPQQEPEPAAKDLWHLDSSTRLQATGLLNTPGTLLNIAGRFRGRKLYREAQETAALAVTLILRFHYCRVCQKGDTPHHDTQLLLDRLKHREALTEDQWRHACDLRHRTDTAKSPKAKADRTIALGQSIFGLFPR